MATRSELRTTRTKVGFAVALLLLVAGCTSTDQSDRTSTLPILPPSGSIDPDFEAKWSSQEAARSTSSSAVDPSTRTSTTVDAVDSPSQASSSGISSPSAMPGPLPTSDGVFTVSVADSIDDADREVALSAIEVVQKSIILRDALLHNGSDSSLDPMMTSYLTGQALSVLESSLSRIRSDGLEVTGWTSAVIDAVASSDGVTTVVVCHDLSNVRMTEPTGTQRNLPLGQRGTYSVAPYDTGLLISVLEYDSSEFVSCT